jgi:hypothetical protein
VLSGALEPALEIIKDGERAPGENEKMVLRYIGISWSVLKKEMHLIQNSRTFIAHDITSGTHFMEEIPPIDPEGFPHRCLRG